MGMESLRVAKHQSLTQEYTLEGTKKIQMRDIDRSSLFGKYKSKLTHGSTPLLPRSLRRSHCIGYGSRA